MAHGSHHHHHHHGAAGDQAARNIGFAFWLNLGFSVLEVVGGLLTQSLAVTSDGLHDFGDALSLGVGYFLQRKSSQGPSETYSYGLRRLSLLSACLSGIVISVGAVYIIAQGLWSFREPRDPHGLGMLGLAIFGIAVNGLAAWRLGRGHTQNEKVLKWHLIEDVLGWAAVLVGALFIYFLGWVWLDPALAIGISAFVLYNVVRGLHETITLFLQANPNPEGLRAFRAQVEAVPGVQSVHDVHFWSLDGVHHILSLHAVVRDPAEAGAVKEQIRRLSRLLGECHLTLEIEAPGEPCHDDCGRPVDHGHDHDDHDHPGHPPAKAR